MQDEGVDWKEVGGRIRNLRREQGLRQAELIEPLASASLLSLIESGTRKPSGDVLSHIAAKLGMNLEELITGRSHEVEVQLELRLQEIREHLRMGRVNEGEVGATKAASEARDFQLTRVEAKSWELLASIEEQRESPGPALACYRKAETLWSLEPAHLRFLTIAGISRCMQALGDARYGIHILESYLLELEREGLPDPIATMRTNSALVVCYSAMGLTAKAAEAAESAQALAPRVTDAGELGRMNMNVTRSLLAQGRTEDALISIRQAELAYVSLGWELDAARAQLSRGAIQSMQGKYEEARQNLTQALDTFRRGNHSSDIAMALNRLGKLERLSGNAIPARDLLLEAQKHLGGREFSERGLNLRELGLCAQEQDPESAKGHLRRAIDLFMLADAAGEAASTYKLLGDLHRTAGEVGQSADAYRAGIEAREGHSEGVGI